GILAVTRHVFVVPLRAAATLLDQPAKTGAAAACGIIQQSVECPHPALAAPRATLCGRTAGRGYRERGRSGGEVVRQVLSPAHASQCRPKTCQLACFASAAKRRSRLSN